MAEVLAGQPARFADLVERYQSSLFRFAQSRLGDRPLAEEATQETFLAAFRHRGSFDCSREFRPWLWRIHANICNQLRRQKNLSTDRLQARISPAPPTPPAELAEFADERDRLHRLLAELPDAQAESLRLRYFAGLKFEEIAQVQGVAVATVKSRVRYALEKLAERYGTKSPNSITTKS